MTGESLELPSSAAYLSEREELDQAVRPYYDNLVQDYRYYALVHHHHPFVSYKVLADLIRVGWRPLSTDSGPFQPVER